MEKATFTKKLAKRIKKIREEKGLTQVELAKLCGLPKQNINRLEAGLVNPSAHFVYEIAESLKVAVCELMDF